MRAFKSIQTAAVFAALSLALCACDDNGSSQKGGQSAKDQPTPGLPASPEVAMPVPTTEVVWGLSEEGQTLEAVQMSNGKIAYSKPLAVKYSCAVALSDSLWMGGAQGSLSHFDFKSGELSTVRTFGGQVGPMVVEAGSASKPNVIWMGHILEDGVNGAKKPEVVEIDAKNGSILGTVALADISDTIGGIVATSDSIFVLVNNHFALYRIDARTLKVSQIPLGLPAGYGFGALAKSSQSLLVLDAFANKLIALDIQTHVVRSVGVVGKGTVPELIVSGGNLFAFSKTLKAVQKLDAKGGVLKSTLLPEAPVAIALSGAQIWISLPNSIAVLDSVTGVILKSFEGVSVAAFAVATR